MDDIIYLAFVGIICVAIAAIFWYLFVATAVVYTVYKFFCWCAEEETSSSEEFQK